MDERSTADARLVEDVGCGQGFRVRTVVARYDEQRLPWNTKIANVRKLRERENRANFMEKETVIAKIADLHYVT